MSFRKHYLLRLQHALRLWLALVFHDLDHNPGRLRDLHKLCALQQASHLLLDVFAHFDKLNVWLNTLLAFGVPKLGQFSLVFLWQFWVPVIVDVFLKFRNSVNQLLSLPYQLLALPTPVFDYAFIWVHVARLHLLNSLCVDLLSKVYSFILRIHSEYFHFVL